MKPTKLNKSWHDQHKMPAKASLEQRMRWHQEHQRNCACRPIPAKLLKTMKDRGLI